MEVVVMLVTASVRIWLRTRKGERGKTRVRVTAARELGVLAYGRVSVEVEVEPNMQGHTVNANVQTRDRAACNPLVQAAALDAYV